MEILLVLFLGGVLFELAPHAHRSLWRLRKLFAIAALVVVAFSAGVVAVWQFNLWSALLAVLCGYRLLNAIRLVEGRMHERYLQRSTLQTSLVLIGWQVGLVVLWLLWDAWHETGEVLWTALAVVQLLVAALFLISSARSLRKTAWPSAGPSLSDKDLPTLTVAIPARNETDDLQACLTSLVRSNYPKLEIIVLDDCSQVRRTPEIIREFAHDGVRFVQGEEPRPTWLAKNQAYERLLKEASGEYVLFCGVDVRFGEESLRQLMATMLHKKKSMISLLPWRAASAERRFAVTQAMRYAWELVPPRRLFRRPPVLSTCWVASKDALKEAGGFEAVTRSVVPEAHFAKRLAANDTYSFMRASQQLGIESTKPAHEQYETAIRMRYPQLHRRPENVFFLSLVYALMLVGPFALAVMGFWISVGLAAQLFAVAAAILLTITYIRVVVATRTGSWWFGLIALPFGATFDIALLHISMWQYEFSVVEWKGRNVCVPAMHVIPHLPKLEGR